MNLIIRKKGRKECAVFAAADKNDKQRCIVFLPWRQPPVNRVTFCIPASQKVTMKRFMMAWLAET